MSEKKNALYFDKVTEINDENGEKYSFSSDTTNVALFAADCKKHDIDKSLEELTALADACGMSVVVQIVQSKTSPDTATYLGEGKLQEGRLLCSNLGAQLAIFDDELSGTQIRNLEEILEIPVIDRTMLILEIFARRAITGEGKLQTELATLQYRLPRLSGLGDSLSRQGGGGGGGGGARRGAGESKLEYDRRHIRRRIDALKRKLKEMEHRREQTRRARKKNGVPVIAVVGYTNVGKSSLLNKICDASVLQADMLFATLDATARSMRLPSGLDVIAIDTVGFVSRLPHSLVNAFKSTLEESAYADVILKVCDASDSESDTQLSITSRVLEELKCDAIPYITVYNKIDKAQGVMLFDTSAVAISAKTGEGIEKLLLKIDDILSARLRSVHALLPYDKLSLANVMREHGSVQEEKYEENGVLITGTVRIQDLHMFEPFLV